MDCHGKKENNKMSLSLSVEQSIKHMKKNSRSDLNLLTLLLD